MKTLRAKSLTAARRYLISKAIRRERRQYELGQPRREWYDVFTPLERKVYDRLSDIWYKSKTLGFGTGADLTYLPISMTDVRKEVVFGAHNGSEHDPRWKRPSGTQVFKNKSKHLKFEWEYTDPEAPYKVAHIKEVEQDDKSQEYPLVIEYVNEVKVDLIHHNLSDNMIAMAAWVSHDIDNEERLLDQTRVKGLINFLVKNKHLSPLEHGSLTVKSNVPLFVRSEWHRHRTQSYNEVSGRYTEMLPRFWCGTKARVQKGKPGDYYFVEGTPEQTAGYLKSKERAVQAAWAEYQYRLGLGIAKEQAREDLPLSLMTQFYATGNLRNWFQFLALRDEAHALEEIQQAAKQVAEIVEAAAPMAYAAFKEYGV